MEIRKKHLEHRPADAETRAAARQSSRRQFLQSLGTLGTALYTRPMWGAPISASARQALADNGFAITLLEDGGFQGKAWGWQFTRGARLAPESRCVGHRSVHIQTDSGDYARFLVIGPEVGKIYTLSGWVKTEGVAAEEESAGAYFAAGQFEFQGRPTVFSVNGKQLHDERFGNYQGTSDWRRFSQSFTCLPGTTWFEVVVGIYRSSGSAWFTDLTFVEDDKPVELEDTVDYWQALEKLHQEDVHGAHRSKPTAAILYDDLPVRGAAADPKHLAEILRETYDVSFLTAHELADPRRLNRAAFDLLVLPYGESFPLPAWTTVSDFLGNAGDLLSMGGYAFQAPLVFNHGKWQFYDDSARMPHAANLLPAFSTNGGAWKTSVARYANSESADVAGIGRQSAAAIYVPENRWNQSGAWRCEVDVAPAPNQYFFQGWIRTDNVRPAPDGVAYIEIFPLDEHGNKVHATGFAAGVEIEAARGSHPWHKVQHVIPVVPGCRKLQIEFGLRNATGSIQAAGLRLERGSPQVLMNTANGLPHDELVITPRQIGVFDASFRFESASIIRPADGQAIIPDGEQLTGDFQGYAATGVIGMNQARWVPLLETYDSLGRKRGAAGALILHTRGAYARSTWACFGVDNKDIFSSGSKLGESTLHAVSHALANKIFLQHLETDLACYRQGESVHLRVLATNFGRAKIDLQLNWRVHAEGDARTIFEDSDVLTLSPGQTLQVETEWHAPAFPADLYRVTAALSKSGKVLDRLETGFTAWSEETLRKGLNFEFRDNYFQVDGRTVFLQGTDDYAHTFINQDENPMTWAQDAQGCHDSCIDVYENLMGLRGPQQRPTETWWRWIDAMLLNVQRAGGVFFPGMLIFSNTSVSDRDLADQQAYVRAFAARYKNAAGLIYYLNGDLELHDPNLPNLQRLYNQFLQQKYGSDDELRSAWTISPPEASIGKLKIRPGTDDWRDMRTVDDFEFRTHVVRRWLDAMHDSIRTEDARHPVTAELYQSPATGFDLLAVLNKLELANFGYFDSPGEDFYRFPQTCRLLDQRIRGKSINVGEFGVKTHPAWKDAAGYIAARSERFEHAYFLAIAHYSFALGVSKIQNWCWKYPSDLPFEWGINYPNELIGRDVQAFYRNTGMFFRWLRPRYVPADIVLLVPGEGRKGGQGARVLEGITNSIRLLIDQRIQSSSLTDEFLDELPAGVKTIIYPLPYCVTQSTFDRLTDFVHAGGQLYISGDITYDERRRRTQTHRLRELCGVEFVRERYANIDYDAGAQEVVGRAAGWPDYIAAPGIELRLAGARSLVQTKQGVPVVTEFRLGRGRVIFSADPVELHGDPRFHPYAHAFYAALSAAFDLHAEKLEPADAPVHSFRVPSQDGRDTTILVNHSESQSVQKLVVAGVAGKIALSLAPQLSGAIVVGENGHLSAVESSGNVEVNGREVIASDLHFMALALDNRALEETHLLLLLPMGEGQIRLNNAQRWKQPIVLIGEISAGRWKRVDSFTPAAEGERLILPISAVRSLGIVVLCEATEQSHAVRQVERLVNQPWLL